VRGCSGIFFVCYTGGGQGTNTFFEVGSYLGVVNLDQLHIHHGVTNKGLCSGRVRKESAQTRDLGAESRGGGGYNLNDC